MAGFVRAHWMGFLLLGILYGVLAVQYPFLWGIWNIEFGIAWWMKLGFTQRQAFCMGSLFGNIECLVWYGAVGCLVKKGKVWLLDLVAVERQAAGSAGVGQHARSIWLYGLERLETMQERYCSHWAYRLLARMNRLWVFKPVLFMLMTALCAAPMLMFPVMFFVHAAKVRWGVAAVLAGNECKIAFFAYGVWPAVFAVTRNMWSMF